MNAIKQLSDGFKSYIWAGTMIYEKKLWIYFIYSVAVFFGIYFLGDVFEDAAENVKTTGSSMHEIMMSLLKKLSFTSLEYLFQETTKYIAIIVLSPVLAALSEKIEKMLTNQEYPFVWSQFWKDVKRGMRISLWCMAQEYLIFIIYLIPALIFGLPSELNTLVALCIGFWFYGFGFMDYMNERRRLNIEQSVHFARKNWGIAVGVGAVYSLSFEYIPFSIGAIFAPIFAIVGTTILMHKYVDLSTNKHAKKIEEEEKA